MAISEEKIFEIKNKNDIESVIAPYVNLKRAGKNFKGLCPFHKPDQRERSNCDFAQAAQPGGLLHLILLPLSDYYGHSDALRKRQAKDHGLQEELLPKKNQHNPYHLFCPDSRDHDSHQHRLRI